MDTSHALAAVKPANRSGGRLDQVLDEAARQLNTRGVSLAALSDIAARLGITRAAMYSYVADREDLVFQCCRRTLLIIDSHLQAAMRASDDSVEVIKGFIDRVLDPAGPPLAARSEIGPLNPEHRQVIQSLCAPIISRLTKVLDAGAQAGSLRRCDSDAMARAILGLVNWAPLAHQWLDGPSPASSKRLSDELCSMVFDGLAADRSAPMSFTAIDLEPLRFTPSHAFDRAAMNAARMEALLLSASRLFNRQGFDSTSLQEIMACIGATKRTLYRHLTDKQALAAACYERAFKMFEYIRDRMIDYPNTRLQALGAAVHAIASLYMRKDMLPIAPPVCYASLRPEDQQSYDKHMFDVGTSYSKTIHAGIDEGSIAAIDERARTALFPGLFSGIVKDDIPEDPAQCERLARAIAELFCLGLRAH